jgi:protein-disulfide isomerase
MRKLLPLLLLVASIMAAGCLPQTQAAPLTTPTTNTRPAQSTAVSVPTQAAVFPDSGCTVVTKKPTPGPTPETVYPPVTSSDWVKGPTDAKVTIIEYSDFQ